MFINSTRHLSYQFQHTAARRRLGLPTLYSCLNDRFQHTAARRRLGRRWEKRWYALPPVSTHSRPKAAGTSFKQLEKEFYVSTHSRPKAAGLGRMDASRCPVFQHTAARRRLAIAPCFLCVYSGCFNTQPPEGGWFLINSLFRHTDSFNTQPPEGGWKSVN